MLQNPPQGYTYRTDRKDASNNNNLRHVQGNRYSLLRRTTLAVVKTLGYPKIIPFTPPASSTVTHTAQYLLKSKKPWVTDFEDASVYTWYNHHTLNLPWTRFAIHKALEQKECKAILPWTDAARKSLLHTLPKGAWQNKVNTVYPCIDTSTYTVTVKRKKSTIHFLFIGSAFELKGGIDTIEAFKLLTKTVDAKLTVISNLDELYRKRYANVKGLEFRSKVPQQELEAIYADADVFIMPTHYDTFGLVYLEAMARGLPCIGTTQFATPEIITEDKTGLLVKNHTSRFDAQHRPYRTHEGNDPILQDCLKPPAWAVKELASAMQRLAENDTLRRRMGRNGRAEVEIGKFSIKERKKNMKQVYDATLGEIQKRIGEKL